MRRPPELPALGTRGATRPGHNRSPGGCLVTQERPRAKRQPWEHSVPPPSARPGVSGHFINSSPCRDASPPGRSLPSLQAWPSDLGTSFSGAPGSDSWGHHHPTCRISRGAKKAGVKHPAFPLPPPTWQLVGWEQLPFGPEHCPCSAMLGRGEGSASRGMSYSGPSEPTETEKSGIFFTEEASPGPSLPPCTAELCVGNTGRRWTGSQGSGPNSWGPSGHLRAALAPKFTGNGDPMTRQRFPWADLGGPVPPRQVLVR